MSVPLSLRTVVVCNYPTADLRRRAGHVPAPDNHLPCHSALFMALRTTGKNISLEAVAKAFSNPSDSVFPRILFLIVSYAVCIMSTEYVGFFVTNAVFGMIYIFFFLERGLIRIVLTPLLLLGVIYGIVVFFLNYPLPSGILF